MQKRVVAEMRGLRVVGRATLMCVSLALAATLLLGGCAVGGEGSTEADGEASPIVLASTTSTQDSGLFDVLIPAFEDANPAFEVKVVAVGTGEALALGERRDADVLLVHAKADEEEFVANGFGSERRDVMYNDFVLLGPADDPAGVRGAADAESAMRALSSAMEDGDAVWVSRGDDSGTHKKELKLWSAAGVSPTSTPAAADNYLSVGQGMGETLRVASEKRGYTLADRATFLSSRDQLDLEVLMEKQSSLLNQYGVIRVNGAANADGAQAFADWITGPEGQQVIGAFGVDEFGQQLFVPNAAR